MSKKPYLIVGEPKKHITTYLDQETIEWLEDQVRKGHFESISDGIRKCIVSMRERWEKIE